MQLDQQDLVVKLVLLDLVVLLAHKDQEEILGHEEILV